MYTHTHRCTCTSTSTAQIHLSLYVCICMYICAYMYVRVHICIHLEHTYPAIYSKALLDDVHRRLKVEARLLLLRLHRPGRYRATTEQSFEAQLPMYGVTVPGPLYTRNPGTYYRQPGATGSCWYISGRHPTSPRFPAPSVLLVAVTFEPKL